LGGRKTTIFVVYIPPLPPNCPVDPWTVEARANIFNLLSDQLENIPVNDVVLVIGDTNSHVGASPITGVSGRFGFGVTKSSGQQLLDWCSTHELRHMNGYFQKSQRKTHTWYHPATQQGFVLDSVLVSSQHAWIVTDVEAVHLPDCSDSDHIPLLIQLHPGRADGAQARHHRKQQRLRRVNVAGLNISEKRSAYTSGVRHELSKLPAEGDINTRNNNLTDVLHKVGIQTLGPQEKLLGGWKDNTGIVSREWHWIVVPSI